MIPQKKSIIHLKQESGAQYGIGDFIVQLPAIYYFLYDLDCEVHYYATEKFKCLLPKHKKLFIYDYNEVDIPACIRPRWGWTMDYCYNHVSALWLPYDKKFERNFFLFRNSAHFEYPFVPFQRAVYDNVIKRLNLSGKKYFTFIKIAYHRARNWTESGWEKLLETLPKNYTQINVGLVHSSKNSQPSTPNNNVIQLDESFSLLEVAHLIRGGEFHISPDTGMYHLATSIGCPKVIVLWHPCNTMFEWLYPNTKIVHKLQPDNLVIEELLSKL
jgi:hypothetical protein